MSIDIEPPPVLEIGDPPANQPLDMSQPQAPQPKPIEAAHVAQFVVPGLDATDTRLIIRMAEISRRGGSATLMRCLGIAARSAMRPDGPQDEISATLQRFESQPPPDDFVIDSLRAALEVQQSGLERRIEPSARARVALFGYDRYRDLLNENRMNPANRMVQYYAIGRIANMIASARNDSPVQ